nr:unnamed protein product [Digitaria exilis]
MKKVASSGGMGQVAGSDARARIRGARGGGGVEKVAGSDARAQLLWDTVVFMSDGEVLLWNADLWLLIEVQWGLASLNWFGCTVNRRQEEHIDSFKTEGLIPRNSNKPQEDGDATPSGARRLLRDLSPRAGGEERGEAAGGEEEETLRLAPPSHRSRSLIPRREHRGSTSSASRRRRIAAEARILATTSSAYTGSRSGGFMARWPRTTAMGREQGGLRRERRRQSSARHRRRPGERKRRDGDGESEKPPGFEKYLGVVGKKRK